jgi:hypothetical protein
MKTGDKPEGLPPTFQHEEELTSRGSEVRGRRLLIVTCVRVRSSHPAAPGCTAAAGPVVASAGRNQRTRL